MEARSLTWAELQPYSYSGVQNQEGEDQEEIVEVAEVELDLDEREE